MARSAPTRTISEVELRLEALHVRKRDSSYCTIATAHLYHVPKLNSNVPKITHLYHSRTQMYQGFGTRTTRCTTTTEAVCTVLTTANELVACELCHLSIKPTTDYPCT